MPNGCMDEICICSIVNIVFFFMFFKDSMLEYNYIDGEIPTSNLFLGLKIEDDITGMKQLDFKDKISFRFVEIVKSLTKSFKYLGFIFKYESSFLKKL